MRSSIKLGVQRLAAGTAASVLAAAGLAAATGGAALAAVTGSTALPAASDCPANAVCMFEDIDFGGEGVYDVLGDGFPSGVCAAINADFVQKTSSIVNNTPRNLIFYVDPGCQGDSFTMTPHSTIGWVGQQFNDTLASVKI
jgi:hypothetical protein